MSRSLKKTLYGFLYLGIFAGIIFGFVLGNKFFYGLRQRPDQPPARVLSKYALSIRSVDMYALEAGQLLVAAEVANPYSDVAAADVGYEFLVKDVAGRARESIRGISSFYAGERRLLYAVASQVGLKQAGSVSLSITSSKWQPSQNFPRPLVNLIGNPEIRVESSTIVAIGQIRNESSVEVRGVQVAASFYDQFGFRLLVHGTYVSFLPSLTAKSFKISVPISAALAEKALKGSVEILLHPVL